MKTQEKQSIAKMELDFKICNRKRGEEYRD
jgi:hypothetical protein